jgi:hypothetical protein
MKIILFLLVVFLAYQNNYNLNLTKNQVIIVGVIAYYFLFIQKENFALSTSVISNTNKSSLQDNLSYVTGTIDPNKQMQTVSPAVNGGAECVAFPDKIYRLAASAPATCRIGASGTQFSGGQASSDNANVDSNYTFGTAINLGSAIKNTPTL